MQYQARLLYACRGKKVDYPGGSASQGIEAWPRPERAIGREDCDALHVSERTLGPGAGPRRALGE